MRTLNRNKRTVYVAKRVPGEVDTYARPFRVKMNLVTTTEYTDIIAFGDRYMDKMRGVVDSGEDRFGVKDKVYVFTTPPRNHDMLAKDADFIVESKTAGLDVNTVILKRTVTSRG